jgi:hypothetical protein
MKWSTLERHMSLAGSHWLSKGNMRFHGTRRIGNPIETRKGILFCTSEKVWGDTRRSYFVHVWTNGTVEAVTRDMTIGCNVDTLLSNRYQRSHNAIKLAARTAAKWSKS